MRSLLFFFLALFISKLHAQGPDVEAWMARHFSGKGGLKEDRAADEALYTALGLDSLRKNRFIGEVKGTVKRPDGSAPVQFMLWSDTLEAVLHFHSPGDTTTYVADLRNNTITIIQTGTEAGAVNTSINDLRERVVANWYRYKDDGSPWRVNRVKPYNTQGGILGEQDMQRWTVANGDTIRFMRYERGPSPFLDALEWLPYGGDHPFNLIMQLARAGDPMPRMLKSRAGSVDVKIVSTNLRPRPAYRIGTNVTDTRTKAHRALPIRQSNRRTNIVELDPMIHIPEDELHLWATADPGNPDEPEVTYTGRRSQMRLHTKEPCGEAGNVVVKVWIDRKGIVQQAEVDRKKSTLHAETCLNNALAAARMDTYYPMEGGIPLHEGELVFEYRSTRGGPGTVTAMAGDPPGRTTFRWEMEGRTLVREPEFTLRPQAEGRVVMDVRVDRKGKVVRAEQNLRGSTTLDKALVDAARTAAMETRFSADQQAEEEQLGKLTFMFRME